MSNTIRHDTPPLNNLVTTYLSDSERQELAEIAGDHDRSLSYVVRQALRAYIAAYNRKRPTRPRSAS